MPLNLRDKQAIPMLTIISYTSFVFLDTFFRYYVTREKRMFKLINVYYEELLVFFTTLEENHFELLL